MGKDESITEILDKIKKLHAKAESLQQLGSLEEAQSFIAGANKLLIENELSQIDLDSHEIKDKREENKIHGTAVEFGAVKSDGSWESLLLNVLAYHNLCKTVRLFKEKRKILVGKKANIEIVMYLYDTVRPIIKDLSNKSYKTTIEGMRDNIQKNVKNCHTRYDAVVAIMKATKISPKIIEEYLVEVKGEKSRNGKFTLDIAKMNIPSPRKVFIRNYLRGAVKGIDRKLEGEKVASERLDELILLNDEKLNEFIDENIGETTETSLSLDVKDKIAYVQGIRDGMGIDFIKGVRNGGDVPTKLLKDK